MPKRAGVFFLIGVMAACTACGAKPSPTHRYHARGIVEHVDDSDGETSLSIHHEAVSKFFDREDQPSQMASMTMIFGVDATVPKSLLRVGKKLAFDFDVRWDKAPALLLVHAEALPPDTTLQLSTKN
jgi:Cu/Ag efflux protein CusF